MAKTKIQPVLTTLADGSTQAAVSAMNCSREEVDEAHNALIAAGFRLRTIETTTDPHTLVVLMVASDWVKLAEATDAA